MPGWKTNRHIVVIESDDWGSIRMPSKEVYEKLLRAGIRVDRCHYCSFDSLAREADLSALFEVLHSVTDKNGCPAVITANAVVANPDFEKIRQEGFERYYNKVITDGFKEVKGCEKSLELWKEGNKDGYFVIQSHGREHLNVARWMRCLKSGLKETRLAFDFGVYGISTTITSEQRKSYLPAFDFDNDEEEVAVNDIAVDGLEIFRNMFGFKSESFIAPNYTWGRSLEKAIGDYGVKYIQGTQLSRYKNSFGEDNIRRLRATGKRNQYGQINLSRNAVFEPSANRHQDWVDSCLADIAIAFRWKCPVIICSHRVNFIGILDQTNRDNGLKSLATLLGRIKQKWPDVEFMSSNQLGHLIDSSLKK